MTTYSVRLLPPKDGVGRQHAAAQSHKCSSTLPIATAQLGVATQATLAYPSSPLAGRNVLAKTGFMLNNNRLHVGLARPNQRLTTATILSVTILLVSNLHIFVNDVNRITI